MPPLFVIGPDGKPEIVNYRAYRNILIVDRLFAAAELRLGGDTQQKVRIIEATGGLMTGTETNDPAVMIDRAEDTEEIARTCVCGQNARLSRAFRARSWLAGRRWRSFWFPQPPLGLAEQSYARAGIRRTLQH